MQTELASEQRLSLLRRNIRLATGLRVLIFASTITTPIILKLAAENGVSQSEFLLLQLIFGAVLLAFDIPAGFFADRFSRKLSLLIGGAIIVTAVISYGLSRDFTDMLIAEIIFGIGLAFCNGADQALLYESLRELEEEHLYEALVRRISLLQLLAMAGFALLGGFLGEFNIRYPYIAEAGVFFLFIICAVFFVEPKRGLESKKFGFLEAVGHARALREHPLRFDLQLILVALTFSALQLMLWFYQPIFDLYEIPVWANGIFFSFAHLVGAGASLTSMRLERLAGGYPRVLLVPLLLAISIYFVVGLVNSIFVIGALMVFQFARGWNNTLLQAELNRNIESDVRATMLSLRTFAERFTSMLMLGLGAILSGFLGARETLLVSGIVMLTLSAPIIRKVWKV